MKKGILIILLLNLFIETNAQYVKQGALHSKDNPRNEWLLPGDTLYDTEKYGNRPMVYKGKPRMLSAVDSIYTLPSPPARPYAYGLRQGLNLSIGLSAFTTIGKHVAHRGGFGQTVNAAYVAPITRDSKLWGCGGVYLNNTTWGGDSYRDAGLYGILAYDFNDRWEVFVYGQLSLANNYPTFYGSYRSPYRGFPAYGALPYTIHTGYGYATPGANILGIGAKYNVSPNFSVQFNVQTEWYDSRRFEYIDRHEYPMQKP